MASAATVHAAIEVAEFFRGHLDRVLPLIGDDSTGEPVGLAARILRYLRMPMLQVGDGWVPRSVVYGRLGNVTADALTAELEALRRAGYAETRTVSTATNTAEQWRDPAYSRFSPSQDSQDSPAGSESWESWVHGNRGIRNHLPPTGTDGVTVPPGAVPV